MGNSAVGANDTDRPDNGWGGGAFQCSLNNCLLATNSALDRTGGAHQCNLTNCTLVGNYADVFGGAVASELNNCIVYSNLDAFDEGNNFGPDCIINYCCTFPFPANGFGNITNAPLFVDPAGGDLHLQSNSACINAGNNEYVTATTDLDGNPRILGGRVDIGAYEFASPELLVQHLTELVNQSSLSAKQPLLATLEAALASVRKGNPVSAVNQLRGFQNKVNAQVEPLDPALAATLIQSAQETSDALAAGNFASRPHGQ
jgi:hypothetical protein